MATHLRHDRAFREASQLLKGVFQLDHSTSVSELGSLFQWQGDKPLQQLKRNLADAYGVAWTFPSTHGTTSLNILALLTACPAGGRVLVNRDAHGSVTAAMIQGGFRPAYLVPPFDPELGLSMAPTPSDVADALDRDPVDCLFLTSPNYFGMVGDLAQIVALAHARGIPVVIDAAHAPHFHFCSRLPLAAEDAGADCITQSTHKVATALSQGSLLLLSNDELIEPLYEHVNELGFVSSSFSYPILASIELGVGQLVEEGEAIWSRAIDRAEKLRQAMRAIPGLTCFGGERTGRPQLREFDTTRVTVSVAATGLTGFEVERRLHRLSIYPELATLEHVLFLVTPGTSDEDIQRAIAAIADVTAGTTRRRQVARMPPPALPTMAAAPRDAKFAAKRTVPLAAAVGQVCGETIATYPPGAPIIAAGEIVSHEVLEYLRCMHANGAVLKGATDSAFRTIKVLDR